MRLSSALRLVALACAGEIVGLGIPLVLGYLRVSLAIGIVLSLGHVVVFGFMWPVIYGGYSRAKLVNLRHWWLPMCAYGSVRTLGVLAETGVVGGAVAAEWFWGFVGTVFVGASYLLSARRVRSE